jgi:hypothetical protein
MWMKSNEHINRKKTQSNAEPVRRRLAKIKVKRITIKQTAKEQQFELKKKRETWA